MSSRDADDDDTVDWPWAIRSLRFFSAAACVSVGVTLLNRTKDSGLPIRASLSHFRPNYRFNFPVFITKPEDAKIGFLFSPVTFFFFFWITKKVLRNWEHALRALKEPGSKFKLTAFMQPRTENIATFAFLLHFRKDFHSSNGLRPWGLDNARYLA